MIFFVEHGRKCLYQGSLLFHIEKNCKLRKFNHIFEFLIQELFDSDYDKNYGGPEVQLFSTNHNYFLQITTSFYKPQLFSTNHNFFLQYGNFFLQITTFFYKSQLFSTFLQLFVQYWNFFLQSCNFFLQCTTFFYKWLLFSINHYFFYTILNLFYTLL